MPPLQIALALLQVLPGLILDVEALFSKTPKSGPQKKAAVMDAVKSGLGLAAAFGVNQLADPATRDQVVTTAGALTDAVVSGFNASGQFEASAP